MDWSLLPGTAFWAIFGLYLLGIVLSLAVPRPRGVIMVAAICAGAGGLAAFIAGIGVLLGAPASAGTLNTNLPFGLLSLHLDLLSAFFLAIIGLISVPVAVYSIGYLSHARETSLRRQQAFGALLNLLLLSLVLIVSAADAIVFLMAWEAMAFLSYLMVNFDDEDPHVTRSAYLMLAVSELGTIGILIAFLLLYQVAGSFGYGALQAAASTLSLPLRSAVFLLAFFGFGAKAGILPLQLWLPEAHPAAPSHISALLSAVIIKLGIYGILRFLFLGAGSVNHATGTRDLGKLGGLVRLMPWTTLFFLIAALAISAVPPFNGYISEWMLLETFLQSFAIPDTLAKVVIAIAGALLALTAGIAVTAFVRLCGVGFLALPRSQEAAEAHESPISMRLAMGFLAFCCLALGVLPTFVIPLLDHVTTPLLGVSVVNQVVPPLFTTHPGAYQLLDTLGGGLFGGWLPVNGLVVIAAPAFSTIDSPTYLFLAELVLIGIVLLALRAIRPLGSRRVERVWAGGIPRFTARMTYTGLAYSNPVRLIFQGLFRSRVQSEAPAPAAHHRAGKITYEQEVSPPFERSLYRPLLNALHWITERARVIQSGNINQYVAYIFLIVLIVLILRAI